MLAAAVVILCWATLAASLCGQAITQPVMLIVLALLVAFVGLPHGAADHRFARSRLLPRLGRAWLPLFLTGYLATAAVVVAGWVLAPAATIVLFLLASAWHFGQEEPRPYSVSRILRPLVRFARGGLVIWTPLIFRHEEVLQILRSVAPTNSAAAVAAVADPLRLLSVVMFAVTALALATQFFAAASRSGQRRWVLLGDCLLVVSLMLLFGVADTLVSFAIYFCGWHSARGLSRLRRELGESWRQLAVSLAPLTAGAIALTALTVGLLLPAVTWDETLVRTIFIGLSAVAVPHLLLHGVKVPVGPAGWSWRLLSLQTGSPA